MFATKRRSLRIVSDYLAPTEGRWHLVWFEQKKRYHPQFKTLKYHPVFPDRFGSTEDAQGFCRAFFRWYNNEHLHSGIAMLTPAAVHYGDADKILEKRKHTLAIAAERHPSRFKGKLPALDKLPTAVWINPPILPDQTEKMAGS
ncbi:MAG: transposase [Magnetococcales bacterium]|nr:transposase [Magnetococcales bacterium]